MANSQEVHFVYLGEKLPRYALASIELASRYSGLNVHLIGNASMERRLRNSPARFTAVEDFYSQDEFLQISKKITYSHSFRQGFWLKTLERFFVLAQYMVADNLEAIFHSELDQLLFRVDYLLSKLEEDGKRGMFLPFQTGDLAIASVLYCNSQATMRSLLDFASTSGTFSNEMTLIANWARQNRNHVFPLPTIASAVDEASNHHRSDPALDFHKLGGVVDAAQLGWWVAGVDPRNLPAREKPSTKFADEPKETMLTRQQLEKIRFNFDSRDSFLNIEYGNDFHTRIFNLHIHSKIHSYLLKADSTLEQIFSKANEVMPSVIPGTRRMQIQSRVTVFVGRVAGNPESLLIGLRRRINHSLGRRPSSFPFVSGDTFRSIATHIWEEGNEKISSDDIQAGDIVFCESDKLENLCEKVLKNVTVPTTLLLGNADKNHTKSLKTLLDKTSIVKTFAQNLVDHIPGVEPLPIGLENAWHSNNGRPNEFRMNSKSSKERVPRVMWTFNIETNVTVRSMAADALIHIQIADRLGSLTQRQHREALLTYSFVASPPGNGLDCHRTWEAMYLGCVPIVLRSHVTQEYERLGLPVWVIDSFEELANTTENQLQEKYLDLGPKFGSEAMWAEYWIAQIESTTL